jgi:hypothetical protein
MQFRHLPTHGNLVAWSHLRWRDGPTFRDQRPRLNRLTQPPSSMKRFLLPLLFATTTWAQAPADRVDTAPQIIAEAFGQLSAALAEAIAKDGPAKAISVCSEQAPKITAEVSQKHGVTLRRASVKPRNPKNAPTADQQAALKAFGEALAKQQPPQPAKLTHADGSISFFAPIVLGNPLCLKCHGEPGQDIDAATLDAIRASYPEDKATGYQLGQLRGLWQVTFPAN